jgi:hypothetical protein
VRSPLIAREAVGKWTTKRAASWKHRARACTANARARLARLKPLTEHLVGKLLEAGEMNLSEALFEIRCFEAAGYGKGMKNRESNGSIESP